MLRWEVLKLNWLNNVLNLFSGKSKHQSTFNVLNCLNSEDKKDNGGFKTENWIIKFWHNVIKSMRSQLIKFNRIHNVRKNYLGFESRFWIAWRDRDIYVGKLHPRENSQLRLSSHQHHPNPLVWLIFSLLPLGRKRRDQISVLQTSFHLGMNCHWWLFWFSCLSVPWIHSDYCCFDFVIDSPH